MLSVSPREGIDEARCSSSKSGVSRLPDGDVMSPSHIREGYPNNKGPAIEEARREHREEREEQQPRRKTAMTKTSLVAVAAVLRNAKLPKISKMSGWKKHGWEARMSSQCYKMGHTILVKSGKGYKWFELKPSEVADFSPEPTRLIKRKRFSRRQVDLQAVMTRSEVRRPTDARNRPRYQRVPEGRNAISAISAGGGRPQISNFSDQEEEIENFEDFDLNPESASSELDELEEERDEAPDL